MNNESESLGNMLNGATKGLVLNENILWLIFILTFVLFLVFSLILVYHWHRFGMRAKGIFLAESVYFSGSVFFLLGAVASVMLF